MDRLKSRPHRDRFVSEEVPEQPELPIGQLLMPIVMLIGMSFILLNEGLRLSMANIAGSVLEPAIPFHDQYFVPTVLLVGSSIMIINTVFRSLFMDPLKQAHLNHRNKQLRQLMNEARRSRDHVRLEKISKPHRMAWLSTGRGMNIINDGGLILGAVLLMAPFGFIPFSNTVPGIALLFLAVGLIQRDGAAVLLGHLANVASIVYFGVLIGGGGMMIQNMLQN